MKVCILGATGMVGKVLTRAALDAGHEVVALVRSPEKLDQTEPHIRAIEGEYFDPKALEKSLQGVDAVLTTIGPPMKRTNHRSAYAAAMTSLIACMKQAEVKRIIAIGGAGLKLKGEELSVRRKIMRRILIMLAGSNYLEKEAEHNELAQSELDWTIVRPPQIAGAKGVFKLTMDQAASMKVDTDQLANYMIEILTDQRTYKTAPFVATVHT